MRLIDGDALVEKFNRKVDLWTALTDEDTANDFAFYAKLADAVEEMPTHGGWVSVEDRLPEKNGLYIVYGITDALRELLPNCVPIWLQYFYAERGGWVEFKSWIVTDWVTHWMPLPEPPTDCADYPGCEMCPKNEECRENPDLQEGEDG